MKEERYSDEVKTLLEAAQQQAVMNYNQELSTVHLLASLCGQEGFFKFLLQSFKIDEKAFTQETKDLLRKIPQVKGQDAQVGLVIGDEAPDQRGGVLVVFGVARHSYSFRMDTS